MVGIFLPEVHFTILEKKIVIVTWEASSLKKIIVNVLRRKLKKEIPSEKKKSNWGHIYHPDWFRLRTFLFQKENLENVKTWGYLTFFRVEQKLQFNLAG